MVPCAEEPSAKVGLQRKLEKQGCIVLAQGEGDDVVEGNHVVVELQVPTDA